MDIEQFSENIGCMRFGASVLAEDGFRYTLAGLERKAGRWHIAVRRNDEAQWSLEFAEKPTLAQIIAAASERPT